MESKKMSTVVVSVKVYRGDEGSDDTSVKLVFGELNNTAITLSNSDITDIKKLFDATFEYMTRNKQIIKFELDDSENDLFNQVSQDIIDQLNSEIEESKEDFTKIWSLIPDNEETDMKDE